MSDTQTGLEGEDVWLNDGEANRHNAVEGIRNMKDWEVHSLYLYQNGRRRMVKEIKHIHFPHMVRLDVAHNKIESVEELPNVSMPHLQFLSLQYNEIRTIRAFRKASWPCLEDLSTYQNSLIDQHTLTQGSFKLKRLGLHSQYVHQPRFIQACFIAKLPGEIMWKIDIQSSKLAIIRSIRPSIERKYNKGNLFNDKL